MYDSVAIWYVCSMFCRAYGSMDFFYSYLTSGYINNTYAINAFCISAKTETITLS